MARKGDGVYKRGDTWRLDCIINGRRYIRTLGRKIKRSAALDIATIKRSEIVKGIAGAGEAKKDFDFSDAVKMYSDWVEANKAESTQRTYKQQLDNLKTEFGSLKLSQITAFAVEGYKRRRAKDDAPVCANREVERLRAVFNWMAKYAKYKGENPASKFEKIKESKGKDRILSLEEEDGLLAHASEPVRSLIVIGLNCGIRVKREGLTLEWESINFKDRTLTVEAAFAKNHEMREIPLNSVALEVLRRLKSTTPGPWVFMTRGKRKGGPWRKLKNFRTAFETARRNAKLSDDITPHSLRHTWASRLGMAGVSTKTLMELGGWSDPKMVVRYQHTSKVHRQDAVELLVRNSPPSTTPAPILTENDGSAKLLTNKQCAPVAQLDRAAVS